MNPSVRKSYNALLIESKRVSGYDITYVLQSKRHVYVRIKSAISMALVNYSKAKQAEVARLFGIESPDVAYFVRSHAKRYWQDEEYVRLYDSFIEFLKGFDASVTRVEPCKYL